MGGRFCAKRLSLGIRNPNVLPKSYIMVVSGKKSNLELKGLRSASMLSLQPQCCLSPFSGCDSVVSQLRVHHCLSTVITSLPAVSIIPILKESRVG